MLKDGNRKRAVKVIKADEKQDRHTLNGEGWTDINGNILEMIVDTGKLPEEAKTSGDCDRIEAVRGEIVRIVRQ